MGCGRDVWWGVVGIGGEHEGQDAAGKTMVRYGRGGRMCRAACVSGTMSVRGLWYQGVQSSRKREEQSNVPCVGGGRGVHVDQGWMKEEGIPSIKFCFTSSLAVVTAHFSPQCDLLDINIVFSHCTMYRPPLHFTIASHPRLSRKQRHNEWYSRKEGLSISTLSSDRHAGHTHPPTLQTAIIM